MSNQASADSDAPRISGFARVRTQAGVRLIRITAESQNRVIGFRVNRDGSRWEKETRRAVTQTIVVVTPDDILERLVLNTFFGEIEAQ